ncbi:AAA family ATPase [Methanobacterium petrolearium]|uniref:AAA family ATPase n=1 Tax=Methanobacterium petrolearium TaxID=710190 RepID=UPI003182C621|nr:hypothetical protein GCM10025861_17110 [Methanobacterium petrolearium]
MKVIGVTGMPGSGKSIVSRTAESLGMKVVRMGDVIRDEAHKQNKTPGKSQFNYVRSTGNMWLQNDA